MEAIDFELMEADQANRERNQRGRATCIVKAVMAMAALLDEEFAHFIEECGGDFAPVICNGCNDYGKCERHAKMAQLNEQVQKLVKAIEA